MKRILDLLRSGRGLSSFAGLALGWMVLVILEGAVVRATGSGAGCGNHWPLCNGEILPHHPRLATVIEFTHRSMTGVCSAFVLVVAVWTFLSHEKGARVRIASVWAALLLITEAFLGAVLVKGGYVEHNTSDMRVAMQCIHFTNTLLLLGALTLTWWWQGSRGDGRRTGADLRSLSIASVCLIILTGATGSVAALADTLFPSTDLRTALQADLSAGSPLLVRMRWMHPAASLGAFVLIGVFAFGLRRGRRSTLVGLLALQFLLGVGDVFALAPIWLQVAHLFSADLLWIALVSFTSDAWFPARHRNASSAAHMATTELVASSS